MQPLDLLIISLATFYCAYAVSSSTGPWSVFVWLRNRFKLGGLTSCLVCLSPWIAALFYVIQQTSAAWIVSIFAIAGASVLVWRYTGANNV